MIKHLFSTIFAIHLFCFTSVASAKTFSEKEVGEAMIKVAKNYNIKPEILYTIASIESNFEPLAIAVETSRESAEILSKLRSLNIRVVFGDRKTYHSKKSLISIYPNDYEDAILIIGLLEKYKFSFDVGLMQINTWNFTLDEVEEMFVPEKNLEKAAIVYNDCRHHFKTTPNRVECYNRGVKNLKRALQGKNKNYKPYWERFKKHYIMYFKETPK
ncbi:MAG TPA: hypothetical protein ENN12_04865 [Epsilonproteobacteria bacterium]|nr:hypothetical protein [Campylobacterota bacterium]